MDLRQLRYFVAAVEQHSMSAAARVCRVTQPTLSAQIRRLEIECSEVLFGRTAVGLRPTKSGQRLYRRLAPLLEDAAHGLRYLRGSASGPVVGMTIAIDYSAASLMGIAVRCAAQSLEGRDPRLKLSLHASEVEPAPADPPSPTLHIRHRIRDPGESDDSLGDVWLCVEITPARRNGRREFDPAATLDGVMDVPRLPEDVRRTLQARPSARSLALRPHPMDAKELILSMLARNRGRMLVPRLAVSPLILNHPRLRTREIKAGLPPLCVSIDGMRPPEDLERSFAAIFKKQLAKLSHGPALPPVGRLPDSRQLRYFLRTLEEGGITRAAAKLNVVQPAVSMQIQALERVLGRKLFDRTPRGIFPTAFGRRVQDIYGPIVDALESGPRAAAEGQPRARTRPVLRVGILPGLDEDSLVVQATTATILDWRTAFPSVELKIVESHSGVLLDWLTDSVIDVAIVEHMHAYTRLKETVLSSEPLAILTAARSSVCAPGPINLADVARLNLVLPSARHGLRALLERTLTDAGLALVPKLELDSMASAVRLVKSGGWATVLPASAVRRSLEERVLEAHPIVRPAIMRELRAVELPRHPKRPLARDFIDFLRARLSA